MSISSSDAERQLFSSCILSTNGGKLSRVLVLIVLPEANRICLMFRELSTLRYNLLVQIERAYHFHEIHLRNLTLLLSWDHWLNIFLGQYWFYSTHI